MLAASVCRVLVCVRRRAAGTRGRLRGVLTRRAAPAQAAARLRLPRLRVLQGVGAAQARRRARVVRVLVRRCNAKRRATNPAVCWVRRSGRGADARVRASQAGAGHLHGARERGRPNRVLARARRAHVARPALRRRADCGPAGQAAAVQRDEGGVRHVALAPAHAGARPRLRASDARAAVPPFRRRAAFARPDAGAACRARRTRTAPSWRRCCSGTRPRWIGTWRRRAPAWVTWRRRTTRARRRTCRPASRSCCSRCRSSRRRDPSLSRRFALRCACRAAPALTWRLTRRGAAGGAGGRRVGGGLRATQRQRSGRDGIQAALRPKRVVEAEAVCCCAVEAASRRTGERLRCRPRQAAQTRFRTNASKAIQPRCQHAQLRFVIVRFFFVIDSSALFSLAC